MKNSYACQAAVIGGDKRQIAVAASVSDQFQKVKVYGHPQADLTQKLEYSPNLGEALSNVKVVILPISGMDDAGKVRGYCLEQNIEVGNYLSSLPEGCLILTGSFTEKWLKLAESYGLKVIQYAEDDEIAILNSIPTAEGAVQIAMEELPITIHGSTVAVIGLGRVGLTVARIFKALGAKVIASARRPALLARAWEMGWEAVSDQALPEVIGTADLVINTVPALVLGASMLSKLQPDTLIIDLASPPGGTDFKAAAELKIKAILAPGLPGKVAPKTAGAILASAIPKQIAEYFRNGGGK